MSAINKTYIINAGLEKVFLALTDPFIISEWSGRNATMVSTEGGKFSLWDGSIHGINRKITNELIVQDWKEEKWEEFSQVTFKLKKINAQTTELMLIHENIPKDSVKSIDSGWDEYYLGPLKELLDS